MCPLGRTQYQLDTLYNTHSQLNTPKALILPPAKTDIPTSIKSGDADVKTEIKNVDVGGKGTDNVVTTDSRPNFVGKLKGEEVILPNVKIEKVTFNKRNPNDTAHLRKDFTKFRKDMLKSMANNPEKIKELKKAGISDNDIEDMNEYGLVPDGWHVHHKIPLDQSGTNDVENLVLIKNDPYHKVITNEQNSLTKGMKPGDSKIVDFPIPEGNIYPPNKE
ncbi:HNH endonuclease [Psychrobacillus psychrotolerans]|uniref:HNH endonuclease n=1 Tax=Psychrobacillus psychrotolerans TaxID=126156 RepID=A0A1I5W529_9BACI|nr:HNH endonuclease [Psychrobacillus psychrotolerans]